VRIRTLYSESFRLAALFTALFLGATLILAGSTYLIVDSAFKAELLHAADLDLAAIKKGYAAEGVSEAIEVINQRLTKPPASDFLVLESTDGKKIAGNLPFIRPRIGSQRLPAQGAGDDEEAEEHEILGRGVLVAPGLYAFSGRDLYVLSVTERSALQTVAWILAGTLLLAAGAGVVLSRGFLRRMDAITDTCRAIMAGRLNDRVPVAGSRDELARLASTINAMLDRIGALMETINQISSDIAHDLRTPLTRLRQHLEIARTDSLSPQDHKHAIERAIAESDNILAVFAALLRIGQIEAGVLRRPVGLVDLCAVLHEVSETYRPVIEDSGHALEVSPLKSARIRGDRELLFQLLANLIENAMVHTPRGTRISLSQTVGEDSTTVSVSDAGAGIPEAAREKVFRRFYRLEQARSSKGSGLGLALVKAIAQFHNATVSLGDNTPGLVVSVRFPIATNAEACASPRSDTEATEVHGKS
jgi:signal transduction histidine kinase